MAIILAIDETTFWRGLVADGLGLKGHEVVTAEDPLTGLSRLTKGGIDLIVLDIQLPGMPGLDLIDQLRRTVQFNALPIIILTGEMQKEQVLRAGQLGVTDYLLKPQFSLIELIDRVEKRLEKPLLTVAGSPASDLNSAGSSVQSILTPKQLLTREQCLERAMQAMAARTLSGVVSKVIASASSSRTEMSDLAGLVGRDPVLSSRVLATANRLENAGDRRVVSTLMDAVRLIGSSTIRDIASSLLVYDAMPAPEPDGYNPIRCWQHSIAVARLCERLALEHHDPIAYLLGLCHDLGEILLRSHFGTEYRAVLETTARTGLPRAEVEKQMLGLTHGELVQSILKHLGLPDTILQPIAAFHAAVDHGAVPSAPAARLLLIADAFSTGMMLNCSDQTGVRPLSRVECRIATGSEDPVAIDCALFRAEVIALTAECARLSSKEHAQLIPPVPVRRFVKVWLARDPSYSSFDPMAASLEPMVDLSIHNRLPQPTELAACNGLIVLTRNLSTHGLTPDEVQTCLERGDQGRHTALYLCGKQSPLIERRGITFANWPIPLSGLAEYVGSLR